MHRKNIQNVIAHKYTHTQRDTHTPTNIYSAIACFMIVILYRSEPQLSWQIKNVEMVMERVCFQFVLFEFHCWRKNSGYQLGEKTNVWHKPMNPRLVCY